MKRTSLPRPSRRQFITLLGGATAASPMVAWGQQVKTAPVIGILIAGLSPEAPLPGFRRGLGELGYVEGENVTFEIRHTKQNAELPALASELAKRPVALIFAIGNANAARAAMAASSTIPIVFSNGGDPVLLGLVPSMNRPAGNVTGVTYYTAALVTKRLGLLRELLPKIATVGLLTNPTNLVSSAAIKDTEAAARSINTKFVVFRASTPQEIAAAFKQAADQKVDALLVDVDAFFAGRQQQIVALAAKHHIPASYGNRVFSAGGGLMSYSDDRFGSRRQAGLYAARILKGDRPADLPILQPTKFDLVINLVTAKALGLNVPPMLLARADEVIE